MIRSLYLPVSLALVLLLSGCNPEGPTGPKPFSLFDVYGLWKVRAEEEGCAPARVFNLQFGGFSGPAQGDSVRVVGSWFLDEKNPQARDLTGFIFRWSGLAYFYLNDFRTEIIEGVFVSNRTFAGAYREEEGGCVVRIRGKFLE